MLTHLNVRNFGLIDEVSLEFSDQLNILTGETGAGKSILIQALRIVLGGRFLHSNVRDAKKACFIEAVFDLTGNDLVTQEIIRSFLQDDEADLIIQRTFAPEGRSKIQINGKTVTLSQLKEMGDHLMDMHGPHDHQLLFSEDSHREMLDRLVSDPGTMSSYQQTYGSYLEITRKIEELKGLAATRDREMDLLAHQIRELERVPLDEGSYQDHLDEQSRVVNAERLYENTRQILEYLDSDESPLSDRLRKCFSPVRTLSQLDPHCESFGDQLETLQSSLDDLTASLRDYAEGLSFEPQDAERIQTRGAIYDDILRKFGPSLAQAGDFYKKAKEKFALLNDLEHNDETLNEERDKILKVLKDRAAGITALRQKISKSLNKTIEKELKDLGISHVTFECRVSPSEFNLTGADEVVFYISPNAGEPLKPLADIVSSGEAARVMLALKKALIDVDPVPVLIFDEIDAQIGGRLAKVVGKKLKMLAQKRQVLLITHLPQIASFAQTHFKVRKFVEKNRTQTEILPLNQEARVEELAEMMSGHAKSKISVDHAADLLIAAKKESVLK